LEEEKEEEEEAEPAGGELSRNVCGEGTSSRNAGAS